MILPELCWGATQVDARSERLMTVVSRVRREKREAGDKSPVPLSRIFQMNSQRQERRAKEKNPKDHKLLNFETMLEFYESKTLFGEVGIHYFDPITGKQMIRDCTESTLEATKAILQRERLFGLCFHFLKNRQNALTWIENNKGHAAAKEFGSKVSTLAENVNRLPGISDLTAMADFVHLHIFPLIMIMTPKANNLLTDRYVRLTGILDGVLTILRTDEVANVRTGKKGEKSLNY